jgi:hypothetical protein
MSHSLNSFNQSKSFDESMTYDESLFMSMWARLGRFLEIYGPKFLDFPRKTDFGWKSSDYETGLFSAFHDLRSFMAAKIKHGNCFNMLQFFV